MNDNEDKPATGIVIPEGDGRMEMRPGFQQECSDLTMQLIPPLNEAKADTGAAVMAMLLGQNIASVCRATGCPLSTMIDRIILAVRTSAENELRDAPESQSIN